MKGRIMLRRKFMQMVLVASSSSALSVLGTVARASGGASRNDSSGASRNDSSGASRSNSSGASRNPAVQAVIPAVQAVTALVVQAVMVLGEVFIVQQMQMDSRPVVPKLQMAYQT